MRNLSMMRDPVEYAEDLLASFRGKPMPAISAFSQAVDSGKERKDFIVPEDFALVVFHRLSQPEQVS